MSAERDELVQIIWDGAVADRVKDGNDPRQVPVVRPKVEALADAILAAGYSKQAGDVEWTVFRASDGENGSPAENLRYSTKAGAQESIDTRYGAPELWEPRRRIVGEWSK